MIIDLRFDTDKQKMRVYINGEERNIREVSFVGDVRSKFDDGEHIDIPDECVEIINDVMIVREA